jgi:hypothetical protein
MGVKPPKSHKYEEMDKIRFEFHKNSLLKEIRLKKQKAQKLKKYILIN